MRVQIWMHRMKKLMFANDKKQQKSTDGNSSARTWGHELGKELFPQCQLTSPLVQMLSQRMMFQHRSIGSPNMLAKS
jgi:hypothetical protein